MRIDRTFEERFKQVAGQIAITIKEFKNSVSELANSVYYNLKSSMVYKGRQPSQKQIKQGLGGLE